MDLADWDEEKVKELVEAFLQVGGWGGCAGKVLRAATALILLFCPPSLIHRFRTHKHAHVQVRFPTILLLNKADQVHGCRQA